MRAVERHKPQERRVMKQQKVINSPDAGLKKAEGKKRKSPCTPYREKGKGKEKINPVLVAQVYSRASART